MSLVNIIMILTETFGKGHFLITNNDISKICPKSYPTGQMSNILALIHDAFQPLDYWDGFMSSYTSYTGVAMDTHIYQMFDDQVCTSSMSLGAFDRY